MRRLLDTVPEPPPLSNGTEVLSGGISVNGDGGGDDAYFNTSLLVILAALLCTLICVLGLNSIVRFAIRCSRRRFASGTRTPEVAAATGLKKQALRQMAVMVYGSGATMTATDCPICLGEFAKGEKVRVLPECRHGFHVRCIDAWLALQSSCPTCRRSVQLLLDDRGRGSDAGDSSSGGSGSGEATMAN